MKPRPLEPALRIETGDLSPLHANPRLGLRLWPGRYSPWSRLLLIASIIATAFLVLPLAALLWRTFEDRAWEQLAASVVLDAVWLSLYTSAIALIFTVVFGTPLAYILARWHFRFRRLLMALVTLPIVLPPAVAGLGILMALGRRGIFGPALETLQIQIAFTTSAVIMAQLLVSAPFYIRAAVAGFIGVPREIEEAARVDGAEGFALFWYVTVPLASRSLGAGLVLCWARALGEFGATILFAGGRQGSTQTMPLLIYNLFERDVDAAIATGILLVAIALMALLVAGWFSMGQERAEGI